MSEETKETPDHNDGTMSGLKKTLLGTVGTIVTAGGVWLTTHLGIGETKDEEKPKTETAAPATTAAPVVINLSNNNTNQQKQSNGGGTVIKERVIEKQAPAPTPAKPKEEEPW